MNTLKEDALYISRNAIEKVLPDKAVEMALKKKQLFGKVFLVAIGKAAWRMAKAAVETIGDIIIGGVVITKYGHSQGEIDGLKIFEAGHPVLDEKAIESTSFTLEEIKKINPDTILFLISGGGSALFEKPMRGVSLEDLVDINEALLKSGASIVEINTIRKHLSAVKGGRFAQIVKPAKIFSLVLSDVLGDRLASIASGPAYPDNSTSEEAIEVARKYNLKLKPELIKVLQNETPDKLDNVETEIIGSVGKACENAEIYAAERGYNPVVLTSTLDCEAREAANFLAAIAREEIFNRPFKKPCAIILGGETVVRIKGTGKGGRNQELALAFGISARGMENVALLSIGTDGTDGPTEAAGGLVDGESYNKILEAGINPELMLENNDSYYALECCGDLLVTGPTGTNVNDLIILLCK